MSTAKKESWIAYLLWAACFLGVCGAHRFYIGQITWGVIYLITFGFCGIGQIIDLFLIPGQVRQRNLVDRALSEDLKNDAIRQATLTIASINASQKPGIKDEPSRKLSNEEIILNILEHHEWLSFGKLCAKSNIPASELKAEISKLLELDVIRASSNEEGAIIYKLI